MRPERRTRRLARAFVDQQVEDGLEALVHVGLEATNRPADKNLRALLNRTVIDLDRWLNLQRGFRPR